jgi:hypothetical protein
MAYTLSCLSLHHFPFAMPLFAANPFSHALDAAGPRVGSRLSAESARDALRLAQAFKVTGSPAVLFSAVRGRNRD